MSASIHQFAPRTLSAPGRPMLVTKQRVALDCGCCIWLGRRVDTGDVAATAEPCSPEHHPIAVRAHALLAASTHSPQRRPLADVCVELLDEAAAG